MKKLTAEERRGLRAKAHSLSPVVMIGNAGLTPAVLHEIDVSLLAHELIKVRVFSDERANREEMLARIALELDAAPVQHIGKLLVLYRERPPEVHEPAPPPAIKERARGARHTQQEKMITLSRRRPRPEPVETPPPRRPKAAPEPLQSSPPRRRPKTGGR
jgi:putative YhbY family RNA-binding protein